MLYQFQSKIVLRQSIDYEEELLAMAICESILRRLKRRH